jgi:hypothetical protein
MRVIDSSIHTSLEHSENSNFEFMVAQNFLNSGIFGLKFLPYNGGNSSPPGLAEPFPKICFIGLFLGENSKHQLT